MTVQEARRAEVIRMKGTVLAIAVLWWLATPSPALAFVPRADKVVVVSDSIHDDVYISGGTIVVSGAIDGDLAVVGGTMTLSGPVTGSILAAGGTLTIEGPVGRSLRAAGGTVKAASRVTADAVLAGGTVDVAKAAEVGRDLVAAGGIIIFSGSVTRNALLTGGRVLISGTVRGDADVRGSQVVLAPSARIEGHLRYTSDAEADLQPGAQVVGGVERLLPPLSQRPDRTRWSFSAIGRLVEVIWLLVAGIVALAVAPHGVLQVAERIKTELGFSLATGFVLLIVVPVGVGILLVTILGIPLGVVAFLLYLATLYPGLIFTAVWFGGWIIHGWVRRPGHPPSPYLALTLGVVGLALLFAIPWVGWVLRVCAVLVGFGAFWATVWMNRPGARLQISGGS